MNKRCNRLLKTVRSPFDRVRVNGEGFKAIENSPFVLSPSTTLRIGLAKHERLLLQYPARRNLMLQTMIVGSLPRPTWLAPPNLM